MKMFSKFAGLFPICMCFLHLRRYELSWPPYTLQDRINFTEVSLEHWKLPEAHETSPTCSKHEELH